MKPYNYLKTIFMAFFSKDLYHQVASSWRGRSFLYLLILLAISWVLISSFATMRFSNFMTRAVTEVSSQMPTLYFQQGRVSTGTQDPVLIRITAKDGTQLIGVIDTQNTIQNFEQIDALILVQSQQVLMKNRQDQIKQYRFPGTFSGTFGPKEFNQLIQKARMILVPLIFVVVYFIGLIMSYICYLLIGLVLALIGLIFSAILKCQLSYKATLSVALIALTPAIVVSVLMILLDVRFPEIVLPISNWHFSSSHVFYLFLTLFYLFFAVHAYHGKTTDVREI